MPINTRGDLIQLPPGERMRDYLRRQFQSGRLFVGCEGDEPALVTVAKEIGPNALIFSSDFPHEVNNDSCREEIEELIENPELDDADKAEHAPRQRRALLWLVAISRPLERGRTLKSTRAPGAQPRRPR